MFRHPAWAVGSYSSGPPAAWIVGTKSTGGFANSSVSPCTGVGQNSVPGFGEFHFCLNLPGKFSQPGTGILPEPCTLVELRPWSPRHRRGHGRDVPEPGDVQAVPAVGRHAVLPDRLRPNEVCHEVAILSSCTSALFSAAA